MRRRRRLRCKGREREGPSKLWLRRHEKRRYHEFALLEYGAGIEATYLGEQKALDEQGGHE